MENYPFKWKLDPAELEMNVRYSIFIITGACAGLPALVWSVSHLIHHRKNGHRISVLIILLLLTDFVELLLSPYILIKLLLYHGQWHYHWTNTFFFYLWLLSRECGLLLSPVVALEGILSARFPDYTAAVFSSPYFIFFYILVFLCLIIITILFDEYHYFIDVSVLIVSVITWIITCRPSCSADRCSHRKPDHHITVVFISTLLVLHLPLLLHFFILNFDRSYYHIILPIWNIPWFLRSMRLISDPLLCVLVCRQNLNIQTSQKSEETSLV